MATQLLAAVLHVLGGMCVLGYFTAQAIGIAPPQGPAAIPRRWLWFGLGVLLVTGLSMLARWHVTFGQVTSGELFVARFGQILLLKVLVVAAIVLGVLVIPRQSGLVRWGLLLATCLVTALSVILVR